MSRTQIDIGKMEDFVRKYPEAHNEWRQAYNTKVQLEEVLLDEWIRETQYEGERDHALDLLQIILQEVSIGN